MRIGIVGLGMGGAALGATLAHHGIEARIFEQAPEIREVGAGLMIWSNGVHALERIGMLEELKIAGTPARTTNIMSPSGQVMQTVNGTSADGRVGYTFHRAELLEAMVRRVPQGNVTLNKRCTGVTETADEVRLDFADGTSESFDLVIGADGLRSVVLAALGTTAEPDFAKLFAYRGLAENGPDINLQSAHLWTDRKKYVIVFPVSGGRRINLAAFVPCESVPESSWFEKGEKAALKAEFPGWDPELHKIIDAMPEIFCWGIYYRDPLPHIATSRIALVGDAAHAVTPHAGMGAGQAIEDAAALAVLLKDAKAADVPERLRLYEQLRLTRVHAVQETTRRNAQYMHDVFPLKPGETRPTQLAQVEIGYDVVADAEALLAGAPRIS